MTGTTTGKAYTRLCTHNQVGEIDQTLMHLSLEEVSVHTSYEVLMETKNNSSLIVIDPQGILASSLSPCPIHLLINNILIILFNIFI
jgi:hypothetical protein